MQCRISINESLNKTRPTGSKPTETEKNKKQQKKMRVLSFLKSLKDI